MPRVGPPDVTGQHLVGRRVSVRMLVERRAGRSLYSDTIGTVLALDGDALVIRPTAGEDVRLPVSRVHRLRVVPASAADILALEEVAALGWRPPYRRWLGRWLLRAAGGWTGRANSVLPLGDPGLPLDEAIAQVTAWYADHGLAARFALPLPVREPLGRALAARGWVSYNPSQVLTASVAGMLAATAAPPPAGDVILDTAPSDEWLAAYHYRGAALPDVAVDVLRGADRPVFATVRRGPAVAAIARAVLDAGWAGVTAVEVAPAYRRQGLGLLVMRALGEWARAGGAERMWLQVADGNTAAHHLYERLGFHPHHRYRYAEGPAAG
jgi:GNAT superfamily N-acetyltransferase